MKLIARANLSFICCVVISEPELNGLLLYVFIHVIGLLSSRHFDSHFEEVGVGVEPWWMAPWKARAEFLLSVIELVFLSLTVEALQGKTCQNSQPSGVGRSL